MAFACRKEGKGRSSQVRSRPRPASIIPNLASLNLVPEASPAPRTEAREQASASKPAPYDLDNARRLADAGRLEEASAICHSYLRESGASAQAYYLLGLVRDAAGDPAAIDFYRKALYLEPNHYETLLQMSLWAQKSGDATRAQTYKSRAQRLKNKTHNA